MGYLFNLAALVCVAIVSVASAEQNQLSADEIAKRLNGSVLSPVKTLELLSLVKPTETGTIFASFKASDFVSFAVHTVEDCDDALVEQSQILHETVKKFDDGSLIFENLNRFCDITMNLINYVCKGYRPQSTLLDKDQDDEAMWFTAEVERYIAQHNLDRGEVINGEAGDVMWRMYRRPCFGGASKRDYCLKLIKQIDSMMGRTNLPPPRYELAYEVCKQWRAVQRANQELA